MCNNAAVECRATMETNVMRTGPDIDPAKFRFNGLLVGLVDQPV